MQKYVHPRAYLPDLLQGSTVSASMRPGGLVAVSGMFIRFARSANVWDPALITNISLDASDMTVEYPDLSELYAIARRGGPEQVEHSKKLSAYRSVKDDSQPIRNATWIYSLVTRVIYYEILAIEV